MGKSSYHSLWSQAFESEASYQNIVEAHAAGPAYDVRLHSTRWPEPGSGIFSPAEFFIKMMLTPVPLVKGGYEVNADHLLRNVVFVPQGAPLQVTWREGIDRSISCFVDMSQLFTAAGIDWSWPDFDLASTFNVGNDYVRAGMRRIAEEVLEPGFASDAQIECTLTFIALEIRRQLARVGPSDMDHTPEKLTAQQLAQLRAMVIESSGAPPTVAELSAACGMNSRRLAIAHKNTTGMTLRSFIAHARLERAKSLLLDGRFLIKQIAHECGFKNSAAFTAAFHKSTGETPLTFRAATQAGGLS